MENLLFADVADQVPKGVDVEDLSCQSPLSSSRFSKRQPHPGFDLPAKGFRLRSQGKVARNRGKNIPSMKRRADLRKKKLLIREGDSFLHFLSQKAETEQAVVWSDKKIVFRHKKNWISWTPHLRIDDSEMNRPPGKGGISIGQDECSFFDIMRPYVMGNINQGASGIDL
jgi:hypothetical protein